MPVYVRALSFGQVRAKFGAAGPHSDRATDDSRAVYQVRDGLDGINLDRITSVALAMTQHARQTPDKAAIITLAEGEAETGRVTFGELDAKARALAGYLRSAGLTGERVMLLLPQDADYIVALIGCLYAGGGRAS
jgi:non-ribosomal peptide synthetase component F